MTDDMDAEDETVLTVDRGTQTQQSRADLKRHIATWAKRWTLGMALSLVAAFFVDRARLLPLITSALALISLAALLVRHWFANRQGRSK